MARALLNFGFFTYRSPHHGSKTFQKNLHSHRESRESLAQRSASRPAVFLLYQDNKGACIVELWLFEALLISRRRSTGTIKAHSVLKFDCFSHRSSHDGVRRLPHHGSRNWRKILSRARLQSSWRSGPQLA